MVEYNKQFLNIEEQINLLKSRGLIVNDEEKAKFFLKHIGYYHLSIYAKAYQNSEEQFKNETTFEDIINLYNFDKKLRILILDILERIEMSFKCVLSHEITKTRSDNYWYTIDKNNYKDKDKIEDILNELRTSKEIYIEHFYKTYPKSNYPPAWIFFESLTFGKCIIFARNLDEKERQIIAGFYKLSKASINMLFQLSLLRNACAHHVRVWNRDFTMQVAIYPKYTNAFNGSRKNSLYAYLVVLQIFLIKISPESGWLEKLKDLISEYDIDINKMGFCTDWYNKLKSIK